MIVSALDRGVVTTLLLIQVAACAPADLSTPDLLQALQEQGLDVASGNGTKTQIQSELDNLSDAIASGAPMPRLVETRRLEGVATDFFFCPGKNEQARAVVAYVLRGGALLRGGAPADRAGSDGERSPDPPLLGLAAAGITGTLNLVFERHIVSMRPATSDDDAILKIALALAEIEAR